MTMKCFCSDGSERLLRIFLLILLCTVVTAFRNDLEREKNSSEVDMSTIFPHDRNHELNPHEPSSLSLTDDGANSDHLRMKRKLMLETMENPNYDALFSGKGILEHQYNDMMHKGEDLNLKMEKDQDRLFKKYENFQKQKKAIKRRRDAALKKVLESASIGNHFLGNEEEARHLESHIVMGKGGLEVKNPARDLRQAKLMGMQNLRDLKHLDILKQLKERHEELRESHEDMYQQRDEEERFRGPRERNLLQISPTKIVKHKRQSNNDGSFLQRNQNMGKGVFKSDTENKSPEERQLRIKKYVRRERSRLRRKRRNRHKNKYKRVSSWRNRKLKTAAKKTTTNKKKTSKAKKLAKKFKVKYAFNWKTLTWSVKKKYKFTLIKSMKDLKFWKAMGLKIKKHLPKLHYHDYSKRKFKKGQRMCILTANFSPLMQNYYTYMVHFKIEFRSNCHDYIAEKVFSTHVHYWRGFRIQLGTTNFYIQYSWRYRYYGYFRLYEDIRMWPKYIPKTFMPWKKKEDLVRIGLVGKHALKWKPHHLKLFLSHGHIYPSVTDKEMAKRKKDEILRKKLAEQERKRKEAERKRKAAEAKKKKNNSSSRRLRRREKSSRHLRRRNRINRKRRHRAYGRRLRSKRSRIHHNRKSHKNHHRRLMKEFHPRYLMEMPPQPTQLLDEKTPVDRNLSQRNVLTADGKPVIKESDFAREPEPEMFKNEIFPPFNPKYQIKPPSPRLLKGKEYDPIAEYDPRPDVANDVREEMVGQLKPDSPKERGLKKIVSPTPDYFLRYGFRHVNSPEGFIVAKTPKKIAFLKKTIDFVFKSASKIGRCGYGYWSHCTL